MRYIVSISKHPGGPARSVEIDGTLTIGRDAKNDLVLESDQVSRRHARLSCEGGSLQLQDLGSRNGTCLDGEALIGAALLRGGERIEIGDFQLSVSAVGASSSGEPAGTASGLGLPAVGGDASSAALRKEIHDRLIAALDLRRLDLDRLGGEALRARSEEAVRAIIGELEAGGRIPPDLDRDRLLQQVIDEVLGLGPLEELLADDEISEVMVNHAEQIFVERRGRIEATDKSFSSNRAILAVIERIVAPVGRRIDEASPMVDARLADGSRVHAIIPPLALKGPCITIRKFKREKLGAADLIRLGSLSPAMSSFLHLAVQAKKNIVISGGTGSGKTTLLNVMTSFIPAAERIITVEDAAELQIRQPHWIQLEARPPNLEGSGAISIRELIKNCLRMRPDRIVVGECRSGEALDMLQAMNTGHDGSLTTLHANSPRDALSRLETMCLMSGVDLPMRAIREQIAGAVDLIVHQARFADGSRRITHVTEVTGMEGEILTLQDVFHFEQGGVGARGEVVGRHRSSGFVPAFYGELEARGLAVDRSIFRMADGREP